MQTFPLVRSRTAPSYLPVAFAAVLVTTLLLGCATAPPVSAPGASAQGATAPAASPPPAVPAVTPPATQPTPKASPAADGMAANDDVAVPAAAAEQHEWLTDAEGHRYYLEPYPKSYVYQRLGEGKVRTVWGVDVEVEREDEQNLYIRIYERDLNAKGPSGAPEPPSEELKASYAPPQLAHVDRLSFMPFDEGLPRQGQWRNNLALADLDGDGHLDIVHAPSRKSPTGPVVFLGDGKGHWHRWAASFPPFPYDYGAAAVGDLDGDGRNDIVLGIHLRGLVALVQRQPGKFELWNQGLPFRMGARDAIGFSSRAVAVLDWNGDHRPDIAALSEGPQLQMDRSNAVKPLQPDLGLVVFLNRGDGSWQATPIGGARAKGLFGDHLGVADLDHDGRPDLVASSAVEGRKDLLFLSGKEVEGRVDGIPLLRRAYDRAVTAADFDGDHVPEVAVGFISSELAPDWRTGIDVFRRRRGDQWERKLAWVEEGLEAIWSIAAGDLDGDHHTDLVAMTGDARVIILLGDGKGGFVQQDAGLVDAVEGCRGYELALADLDGDGRDDIVAGFAGEQTGLPGIIEEPGCPGGGSLRAWRSVPHSGG